VLGKCLASAVFTRWEGFEVGNGRQEPLAE
jgi:hypothetical protein